MGGPYWAADANGIIIVFSLTMHSFYRSYVVEVLYLEELESFFFDFINPLLGLNLIFKTQFSARAL